MPGGKILIFGNSHIIAIEAALATMTSDEQAPYEAHRFSKIKNDGSLIEGIGEEAGEAMLAQASPEDRFVSAIGGNQFNTFGLLRHSQPFDFFDVDRPEAPLAEDAMIIPVALLEDAFDGFVRGRDGTLLARLAAAGPAAAFHLEPPPPKGDNEFIRTKAETYFRAAGIEDIGVSDPALRLKLWRLQSRVLKRFCAENGVTFVESPAEAQDEAGFLRREYYGRDATHANVEYGKLVIRQIAALAVLAERAPIGEAAA